VAGTIRSAEHGCNEALPPMPQDSGSGYSSLLPTLCLKAEACFHLQIKVGEKGVLMEEKLKIRPLKLRHLQKQKCQAAMMTLRNATDMVFLPRERGLHCLFRKG
jgi:hypothetical protein